MQTLLRISHFPTVLKETRDTIKKLLLASSRAGEESTSRRTLLILNYLLSRAYHLQLFLARAATFYLQSSAKLCLASMRAFACLITSGLCGEEEEEDGNDEGEEDDGMVVDGTGMGEGRGNENVSKQIEHEEQLEGLKDDQPDEQKQEKKKGEGEEEQKEEEGFEMQEDFKG